MLLDIVSRAETIEIPQMFVLVYLLAFFVSFEIVKYDSSCQKWLSPFQAFGLGRYHLF